MRSPKIAVVLFTLASACATERAAAPPPPQPTPPVSETRSEADDAFRGLDEEEARAERREEGDPHEAEPGEPEQPLR